MKTLQCICNAMVSSKHYNAVVVIGSSVLDFLFFISYFRMDLRKLFILHYRNKKKMECIVCQNTKGKENLWQHHLRNNFENSLSVPEKEQNIEMERWWNW